MKRRRMSKGGVMGVTTSSHWIEEGEPDTVDY